MRTDGNLGATVNYHPNSHGLWGNQPEYAEPPLELEGYANRHNHYADDDHYEQPGNLFRKMSSAQQQVLFENAARAMDGASEEVLLRHIQNCRHADPAYGEGVARALKTELPSAV